LDVFHTRGLESHFSLLTPSLENSPFGRVDLLSGNLLLDMTLFPQSPQILHWILNPTSPQPTSVKVENLQVLVINDPSVAVLEGTIPEVVIKEGAEFCGIHPRTKSWLANKELLGEACNLGITVACSVYAE
jgi:hypothetical protein